MIDEVSCDTQYDGIENELIHSVTNKLKLDQKNTLKNDKKMDARIISFIGEI